MPLITLDGELSEDLMLKSTRNNVRNAFYFCNVMYFRVKQDIHREKGRDLILGID